MGLFTSKKAPEVEHGMYVRVADPELSLAAFKKNIKKKLPKMTGWMSIIKALINEG